VRLEGKDHVQRRGTSWRTADPRTIAHIMSVAERVPTWTCDPARIATDQPGSIITVSRHTPTRRIVHDHGDPCAPAALHDLEMDIAITAKVATILAR